ncbi:hypothetical protein ACFYVL_09360 [Streptomyces sp. NPDC004111]|uniref:hypothetical protein n=1 Tax=Streptomyces sp. NPDC004111 TaxID=3364690 RepID=UPI0036AABEAB
MAVIDQSAEDAKASNRDRYGRTVRPDVARTIEAAQHQEALDAYASHLAPHAADLLAAARTALDELPPAQHLPRWRALLGSLADADAEIRQVLAQPDVPGSDAEHLRRTRVWPYLTAWADHGPVATALAEQPRTPADPLPEEERRRWTERARAAQERGDLDLHTSWYAADGRIITLAFLVEDDDSTVIALAGDPDAPGWQVLGHFDDMFTAGQALPAPVPPGVFRADASPFDHPAPAPERGLQELLRDITVAQSAGEVSDALLTATEPGYCAGPLVRLQELLHTAGQAAAALETVQGQQISGRLSMLARQLGLLTDEVQVAAEDLGATVAVLPPHRTPLPRARPRPAVDTAPPPSPGRATAPTRSR